MAERVNIIMDQGATFNTQYVFTDDNDNLIDFSTYTANSQMRKAYTSNTAYVFAVSMNSNGTIILSMNSATTSSITAGRYMYDLEVQDTNGTRSRLVEGMVTVTPEITR
jgi:hypothetical protein